ncbi:hypothetical protein ACWY4P_29435 [Streptomyces sp. LZ34]
MATRRRQAAHDSGEDIWNRVEKAGEAGLLTEQATGRNTRGQFERGKAWIKENKCKSEKKGWVYHHGVYTITVDPYKCTLYATDRLRSPQAAVKSAEADPKAAGLSRRSRKAPSR